MVNMIGFHHREPVYNTATPGEDGFYIHVLPRPTAGHPHRALVSTPTAHALWDSPEEAQAWADHPGTFPVMVKHYAETCADAQLGYLPEDTECATDTCGHPPEDHADDGNGPCQWCDCEYLREDIR